MPAAPKPVMMLVTYRPKKGKEDELFELVKKHWPVLSRAGLVTKDVLLYRATDKRTGAISFVEIFSWKDEEAPGLAHQLPEIMAIWEPMSPILEGGPSPELAFVEAVSAKAS